jgi:sugar lactone lactonase YvrE
MKRFAPSVLGLFAFASFASFASPARAQFVDGDLYVTDHVNFKIYRVEPGTWNVTTFADVNDNLSGPTSLIFSPARTLLCGNFWSAQILEFDAAGNGSLLYDSTSGLLSPFGANGLAYDANWNLYVSDFYLKEILCFPAGGGSPVVFADASDGIDEPDGIAFAANGDLYVANRNANTVLTIDPAGGVTTFDTLPYDPYSIVIRDNGDIFVATKSTQNVYKYPGGDVSKRKLVQTFTNNTGNPSLQLSLDQSKLYYTSFGTGNLIEIDTKYGSWTEVIKAGGLPYALAIAVVGTSHIATWSNYGSGLAGTHGVPFFDSQQNPVLGATITLDLGNSYGQPTTGLVVLGFQQASLHTGLGSDLLLIPALLVPVSFSYGADSFDWSIPNDPQLYGLEIDLQAVESDPGAVKGVSFTQGLQLLLGS